MKFERMYNIMMEAIFKRECAWCKKDMTHEKDKKVIAKDPDKYKTTHGICDKCSAKVRKGLRNV